MNFVNIIMLRLIHLLVRSHWCKRLHWKKNRSRALPKFKVPYSYICTDDVAVTLVSRISITDQCHMWSIPVRWVPLSILLRFTCFILTCLFLKKWAFLATKIVLEKEMVQSGFSVSSIDYKNYSHFPSPLIMYILIQTRTGCDSPT